MKKIILILIIILILFPNAYSLEKEEEVENIKIFLKSRQFIPNPGINQTFADEIKLNIPKKTHVILQLNTTSEEVKEYLKNNNVELLSYIPNKGWFASIPSENPEDIAKLANVRAIEEILRDDKISPAVKNNNYIKNQEGTLNLSIMFFKDIDLDSASLILENYGEVINKFYSINTIKIITEESFISNISNEETVQWIDVIDKILQKHNDGNRKNVGVNILQASPYSLSGINIVTSQWDGGWVDATHDDLQGRVTIGDTGSSTDSHATHVAGTMLGNGTLSQSKGGTALQWRGMAPKATVISYEWWGTSTELNNEYNSAINTYGASLSQNSWGYTYTGCGSDCSGGYDSNAAELDGIVRGSKGKKISQIWSAGNNRPTNCDSGSYDCIGLPGTAKNVITVGATNSNDDSMTYFSSWGPTNDGRIKPEVTAPGCEGDKNDGTVTGSVWSTVPTDTYAGMCGTSMSAPTTSGVVALMLEEFANKGIYPLPSTIKAILIHTAKDLGNIGPDYSFGYGRINATAAVDMIKEDTETNDVIIEDTIFAQGKTDEFNMTVPESVSSVKVTLVWDDYPAAANADLALVNNLDLVLIDPSGTPHYPWVLNPSSPSNPATNGIDNLNPAEQVYVENPQAGIWTARVKGTTIPNPPQNYSIVSDYSFSIKPTVVVNTFKDSSYTKEDKFFSLNGIVYIQANVTVDKPVTGATVTADLILSDKTVEDSLSLTEIGNGIYRNSWDSSLHSVDVYLVDVNVSGEIEGNGKSYFHLYPGSGVSAYQLDWNDDKNKDYVFENKHLISVFNKSKRSPILYLEQKDEDINYNFLASSFENATNNGGISSDEKLIYLNITSFVEGENLNSAGLETNINIVTKKKETTIGMLTYYDDTNGASADTSYAIYKSEYLAQSFKVNKNYTITNVSLRIRCSDKCGTLTIKLEGSTGSPGVPNGNVLASAPSISTGPNTMTWVTFTFTTPYNLTKDTMYFIVAEGTGANTANCWGWQSDNTAPTYVNGHLAYNGGSGTSWTASTDVDAWFRVYGQIAIESESISFGGNLNIKMKTQDVDYLVYNITNFNSTEFPDSFFSDITGTLGSSVSDDRYHVGDGSDALVTSLTTNTWTNFIGLTSQQKYVAIYDNTTVSDLVNNNVLGWVHFSNTSNPFLKDVGLWYETGKEGLRVKYNTSNVGALDKLNYLLVFTKGDWRTINQWMSNISQGKLPSPNFMTPPSAAPSEFISITLLGFPIDFGNLNPNTINSSALGNDANQYKIIVNPETTVNVDIYQKGDNFTNSNVIAIDNVLYNKVNSLTNAIKLKNNYENAFLTNIPPGTTKNTYYWINIPTAQKAGDYTTTIYIKAVKTGSSP